MPELRQLCGAMGIEYSLLAPCRQSTHTASRHTGAARTSRPALGVSVGQLAGSSLEHVHDGPAISAMALRASPAQQQPGKAAAGNGSSGGDGQPTGGGRKPTPSSSKPPGGAMNYFAALAGTADADSQLEEIAAEEDKRRQASAASSSNGGAANGRRRGSPEGEGGGLKQPLVWIDLGALAAAGGVCWQRPSWEQAQKHRAMPGAALLSRPRRWPCPLPFCRDDGAGCGDRPDPADSRHLHRRAALAARLPLPGRLLSAACSWPSPTRRSPAALLASVQPSLLQTARWSSGWRGQS